MRTIYKVHGDEQWGSFEARTDETTRTSDEGSAGRNISLQQPLEQPGSGAIHAALSWLLTFTIEGFAAYAEAMHPCFPQIGRAQQRGHDGTEFAASAADPA